MTSGGCAGRTVELAPFTVAGSLRARLADMSSARSHGLGKPLCCSPRPSLRAPADGAAEQPATRITAKRTRMLVFQASAVPPTHHPNHLNLFAYVLVYLPLRRG